MRVNLAFLADGGIYYAIQYSVGTDMLMGERLKSFREFCEDLMQESELIWYERLVSWHLALGAGRRLDRAADAVAALRDLSRLLDRAVGGAPSMSDRFAAERHDISTRGA